MICVERQYFSINRFLLRILGLWPYQRSKLVCFQSIVIFGIMISFIIFQFMTFMTEECTFDHIIKILSSTIFFILLTIEYNSFRVNIQIIKYSLEKLQHICNELKDENEIAIMKKYGNNVRLHSTVFLTLAIFLLVNLIFLPMWPRIINVILPVNISQSHFTVQIHTEYFIDREKYFYLILLHLDVTCCAGVIIEIATGSMLIGYFKHACGMFRIASYRIERAVRSGIRWSNIDMKYEIMVHNNIIYAVDIHRKAMKFSEHLILNFEGSFCFMIVFGVICLSLNLFRVYQLVSYGGDFGEFATHLVYITIIVIYMFLANHIGQEILDHNNHVFFTAYNVRWYLTSLRTQKLIFFLLQRGNKSFGLNIGGLFVPSLENFTSLASASISYFTVIYSTQK